MAVPHPDLAVVFPNADTRGGVERVALEFLTFEAARRPTTFVGRSCTASGVRHEPVTPRPVPAALAPLAFRQAAGRTLRRVRAGTTVSFGVECPPGDVYWVHSVHAAWLRDGGEISVRGHRVPPAARRLLPRHQVLLRLEHAYFTRHHPRLILCTSPREVDDLVELYAVPRSVTRVVPNGVDGARFDVGRRAALREPARASIGAGVDDIVVLLVANEWHRKGLGTLIEAVAAAGDRRLRIDLVGRTEPTDYRRLAERLDVRLTWHGSTDDVPRYYAAADVFALPTTYEPFGNVIIEAMSMGLPAVVSGLAGAAAAITDGVSGLLLDDPRDPAALATALGRLGDAGERDRIGAAAAVAAGPYEWSRVLERADAAVFDS